MAATPGLDFAPDRNNAVPLWLQLMRAIEQGIADRVWAPGQRLPTERELCATTGMSRTSVRSALARLEQAGLISRRQGAGAFVETTPAPWAWTMPGAASIFDPFDSSGASPLDSRVLHAAVEPVPPFAAAAFGDPGSLGVVIERVRLAGKLPAVHVVNYLPKRYAGILPDVRDGHTSLYATLARVADVHISRVHRTVEAALADRQISRLLEIEEGHPVIAVELVAYGANSLPVDISRATVRTDRLKITVDSGHLDSNHPNDAALHWAERTTTQGDDA